MIVDDDYRRRLLSDTENACFVMLDFLRVETDAIRAGSPGCRRRVAGRIIFRRLWTVWPKRYRGTGWLAGHADFLPVSRTHSAGLRSSCSVTRRTPHPGRPRLVSRGRFVS